MEAQAIKAHTRYHASGAFDSRIQICIYYYLFVMMMSKRRYLTSSFHRTCRPHCGCSTARLLKAAWKSWEKIRRYGRNQYYIISMALQQYCCCCCWLLTPYFQLSMGSCCRWSQTTTKQINKSNYLNLPHQFSTLSQITEKVLRFHDGMHHTVLYPVDHYDWIR